MRGNQAPDENDWRDLPGFPNYAINPFGEITQYLGGMALRYDINQVGIVNVSLYYGGRQYRRSVAKMVAQAFLQDPPFSHFNTIMYLDGDRSNLYVSNLMWRPRWYAIEYHHQFDELSDPSWMDIPVEVPKTGEFFDRSIDFCMEYGVLVRHVIEALRTDRPLPLIWMEISSPELSPVSYYDTI